jgi:hypothetical protein
MNYGKKVEGIEFVTRPSQVINVLDKISDGRVFRVDFKKLGDGSMRTLVGRKGVSKGVKGTGKRKSTAQTGLVTVFEFGQGFKQFQIDNVKTIKHAGIIYKFDLINQSLGQDRDVSTEIVGRTVPAYTSPMYT